MSNIGIINCGMGNLTSVKNSFINIGLDCDLVDDASRISGYEKLVLPGVGAFHSMVKQLRVVEINVEFRLVTHSSLLYDSNSVIMTG